MIDSKMLYQNAAKLAAAWLNGLPVDFEVNTDPAPSGTTEGNTGIMTMLLAAQLVASTCVGALDNNENLDRDDVYRVFCDAMVHGTPSLWSSLHLLNSSFVLPEGDPELAACGLSVAATEGAARDHREALIRLMAARRVIERVVDPSADELRECERVAEELSVGINGILDDDAPRMMSKGGNA